MTALGVVDDCELTLTAAERGEQHRVVALALGETVATGLSVATRPVMRTSWPVR